MKKASNINILYVEDEKGVRDGLSDILSLFCINLYVACDGVQGLELYKKYKPDIVVSDIRMPKMDGIIMATKIKEIDENQHIIFTSAYSEDIYFIDAIELQVDGYILKPINIEKLEKTIEMIFLPAYKTANKTDFSDALIQADKLFSMKIMLENIAHQWRQPLCSISTDATGLIIQKQMNKLSDESFFKNCENINSNALYLSDTIDELSQFIKEKKDVEKFNLRDSINSILNLLDATILNSNIKIINNIHEDIFITSLQNEFKQALLNIFINTKEVLESQKTKYIFIDIKKNENSIIISIKDNGGGIDEYILTKIFEPYFTTKHQSRGTGLGLYVSFDIISNILKGSLDVENKNFTYKNNSYIGAEFSITLPILQKE